MGAQPELPDVAATSKAVVDWIKDNNKFGPGAQIVEIEASHLVNDLPQFNYISYTFGPGLMKSGKAHQLLVWAGQVFTFQLTDEQAARLQPKIEPFSSRYENGNIGREQRYTPPLAKLSSPVIKDAKELDPEQTIEGAVEVNIQTEFPKEIVLRLSYRAVGATVRRYFYPKEELGKGTTKLRFSFGGLKSKNEESRVKSQPLVLFLDLCIVPQQGQVDKILSNTVAVLVDVNAKGLGGTNTPPAPGGLKPELTTQAAEEHVKQGDKFKESEQWDKAITEYREAIRLKPDYPEAHSNLGDALDEKGDRDGAIAEEREAIRLKPDFAEAHWLLGARLLQKGDWDGAIAEEREAVRLKPDLAAAHRTLSFALLRKGNHSGSAAEGREASRLELAPELARSREAVRIRPDDPRAHFDVGTGLNLTGDWDGAIPELREAIRLKPDYAVAHLELGWALVEKGDLEGAVVEEQEAIRVNPNLAGAHNLLGVALERKGMLRAARDEYRKASELDPNTLFRSNYERLLKTLKKE